MTIYDPPSDPYYTAHPCRECDQEMEQDYPGVRGSDWICKNPECPRNPCFEPPRRGYCIDCGINDFMNDDWCFVGCDDDTELWRCSKCDAQKENDNV